MDSIQLTKYNLKNCSKHRFQGRSQRKLSEGSGLLSFLSLLGLVCILLGASFLRMARADDSFFFEAPDSADFFHSEETFAPTANKASSHKAKTHFVDPRIPLQDRQGPRIGLEFGFLYQALGNPFELEEAESDSNLSGLSIRADYQPRFFQRFGVLSFGPSLQLFYDAEISSNLVSLRAAGGQVRYQAFFFRNQPIVPTIGYSFDYLNFEIDGDLFTGSAHGPLFELGILLNFFDPRIATDIYQTFRVRRTYLLIGARLNSGDLDGESFSGTSYHAGLRMEF
jgi:hypothetical protein